MKKLRILLADDHDLIRRGLHDFIEREPDWKVCGSVATGIETVEEARRLKPDILVVDLHMPDLDGLEVTRRIKRLQPACEVIIFTGDYVSDEVIRNVFASGAKSYILKTDAGQYLMDAIRHLSEHKPFFTDQASAVIFARFNQPSHKQKQDAETMHERLAPEEIKLVRLLSDGLSNAEVATRQSVSIRTIENMRAGIMRKLQISSFADLIRYAARNDIIKV